jgi:hypothetical protein
LINLTSNWYSWSILYKASIKQWQFSQTYQTSSHANEFCQNLTGLSQKVQDQNSRQTRGTHRQFFDKLYSNEDFNDRDNFINFHQGPSQNHYPNHEINNSQCYDSQNDVLPHNVHKLADRRPLSIPEHSSASTLMANSHFVDHRRHPLMTPTINSSTHSQDGIHSFFIDQKSKPLCHKCKTSTVHINLAL